MASLAAVRDAIKATLEANIAGIHGYDTVPEVTNLPAIVAAPVQIDFTFANARGTDEYQFDLFVLVSTIDMRRAQELLDSFITGAGASSVREVIYNNSALGLADGTDAHVANMRGYGGSYESANIHHIGAILRLVVYTPGAA